MESLNWRERIFIKNGENIKIEIVRSNRKTIAIEIKPNVTVLVRVPLFMKDSEIYKFVTEKESWIKEHLKKMEQRQKEQEKVQKLTMNEVEQLANLALTVIPEKVNYYARIMNVTYGRITIRNQKTRWGSCSEKGNLNFNCLLMLVPDEVIDYVVVHELCHLIEMNHSKAFWKQVEQVLPAYKGYRQWLKEHGNEIMSRMWQ